MKINQSPNFLGLARHWKAPILNACIVWMIFQRFYILSGNLYKNEDYMHGLANNLSSTLLRYYDTLIISVHACSKYVMFVFLYTFLILENSTDTV